jgi:hypothetical protein
MAYMPVEFDLHDFKLNLNTAQSAKFHKRLKELGFDSVQNGDTLVYARGKSRITAFVHSGSALNFLPDFFDDTPGGTVYAIMEKMCVAFGGTMVGKYSIPSLGKEWDVRISGGMNLSGRADVGKRDTVIEDDPGTGHLAPSAGAQSSGRANTQQAPTQSSGSTPQPGSGQGGGQVQGGPAGESARDKLYRVFVEEAYQKHVDQHGVDPAKFVELVQNFKQQFPEETQEEKKRKTIIDAFKQWFNNPNADENWLAREIQLLIDNEEEVAANVADQFSLDEDEVEQVMNQLLGQTPTGSAVSASMKQAVNQVQNAMQNTMNNVMSKMTTQAGVNTPGYGRNMPAGWTFDAKQAQTAVRNIGAYLYYATHSPQNIDVDAFGMHQGLGTLLVALRNHADGQTSTEEIYDMLEDSGIEDIDNLVQQSHTLMSQMKQVAGV